LVCKLIDMNNERIDNINEDLCLIQKTDGLTFGTDAYLLYAYIRKKAGAHGADLGAGTGIISFLCLSKNKLSKIDCVEIQPQFCELINRNAALNSLCDRINVVNSDVRELLGKSYDIIFSNPPYMKNNSGMGNTSEMKNIARREVFGDISDFCAAASKNLKFGGAFYCVYKADRAIDLVFAMRSNGIEPKRLTFVYPDAKSRPSIVLIEGKKGASSGVFVTPALIMHEDSKAEKLVDTDDLKYIYDNGEFHERFIKP